MRQKFPGFKACLQMMRQRDPQVQEDGFHWLRPHVSEYVPELIAAFSSETDMGLKCWQLELIGETKSPAAFSLLAENLQSDEESLSHWALIGLQNFDTKEARTLLRSHFSDGAKETR